MKCGVRNLARMIDYSAVAGGIPEREVVSLAADAKKHRFIGAMVMPCYVKKLADLLAGEDDIFVSTVIGFPSGAHTTAIKAHEAKIAISDGARELDMVVNVGALRSGDIRFVTDDIRAVVAEADGHIVKVILETHYLTHDEIKKGCEASIEAGARFVKTSTGWAPTGATVENVALIKSFVGGAVGIKAAGGIRSLTTLVDLYKAGATRFGVSCASALKILEECSAFPDGVEV